MRVLITGIDGYLGWSLAQYLASRGHEVGGIDDFLRRKWVEEMGSLSAIPIATMTDRMAAFYDTFGNNLCFEEGDLRDYQVVQNVFHEFQPDAVVHFGECPSAPYSMIDRDHTLFVQMNNLVTTFNILFAIRDITPDAHLVKLGTMGEYGTPDVDIPEGFFDIEYRGRQARLPFPRQAGSWYHWSKVHGSNNIMFASQIWGLRATDVMQGVVFGASLDSPFDDPRLATRLDFDQAFGTVINRFCCQAVIEHPLTVYGMGHQKRGFIPLKDSMQCLTLALENPPEPGEYRVFNQFERVYSVQELANKVRKVSQDVGLHVRAQCLENPRAEQPEHYYNPDHDRLFNLGYSPSSDIDLELEKMLMQLIPHKSRIEAKKQILLPDIKWTGRKKVHLGHNVAS